MELQSRLAIRATKNLGTCTIWVHEKDYAAISPRLKRMAEILPYQAIPGMKLPWSSTPKWGIEPRGDVVVGLDSDVMVWREDLVLEAAKQCLADNAVYGTVTYIEILPESEWRSLFADLGLPQKFPFEYTVSKQPAPFHINNGVVMMPTKILPDFRASFYKWLPEINRRYPDLYYMCELATTIGIMKAELNMKAMPKTFNYVEVRMPGLPDLKNVAFLHYNTSRKDPLNTSVQELRERCRQLEEHTMPITTQEEAIQSLKEIIEFMDRASQSTVVDEFAELRKLLESPEWPEAAPGFLICQNTEEDKINRAKFIIDLTVAAVGDLKGRKFLDFGCGEGHTTRVATDLGAVATGYDLEHDWEAVKTQGPFDAVLIYDVLDHCQDPVKALTQLSEVVTPETKIFCRCHPWPGPHAAHCHQQKNKAYIHLVFTEKELRLLGIEPMFVRKVKFPVREEYQWFSDAKFSVTSHSVEKTVVSDFFKTNPLVVRRLALPEYDNKIPEWQMSQEFNDFLIQKIPFVN